MRIWGISDIITASKGCGSHQATIRSYSEVKVSEAKPKKKPRSKTRPKKSASGKPCPADRELTPKQEAFVQEFIITGNKTRAYQKTHDTKLEGGALSTAAYNAFNKTHMKRRYEELKQMSVDDYMVTKESLAREFDQAMELAKKCNAPSAYAAAANSKAKLYGQMTDKVETKVEGYLGGSMIDKPVQIRVIHVSPEEFAASQAKEAEAK